MRKGCIETAVQSPTFTRTNIVEYNAGRGCVGVRDGHPVLLSHCSLLGCQDLAKKAVFFIRLG